MYMTSICDKKNWTEVRLIYVEQIKCLYKISSFYGKRINRAEFSKMPNCGAINCTNCSGNKNDHSFHRVSSQNNKKPRTKWLQNKKRQHPLPSNNRFFVCFDHFKEDCFETDIMVDNNFHCFV